eukprot:gnl/MRDRNA2_/MRDRNA2_258786_c0_seq1.p1 gnl/MRDRNA2_/MRDRNA2_258786_c0~~gnl/MRDRNA2_/MRDRNA2_258786_c0_seq1.p1  ORF type:complete len:204 (+),score=28.15 gnl/MRDRNA2_/MRDRNA2_258786_c0_seq1:58-612(+)
MIAVAILSNLGYKVCASTGRPEILGDQLRSLGKPGSVEVVNRLDHDAVKRPLGKQLYGGVIDTVGGSTLASALALTKYRCAIASCGVAGGGQVNATVYPWILRNVRVLGIDTTLPWDVEGFDADPEVWKQYRLERLELWDRLAEDLPLEMLERCTSQTVGLQDVPSIAEDILAGRHVGRIVVEI